MAATEIAQNDPLLNLRASIAASRSPILTKSADPTSAADTEPNIAFATHLQFNYNSSHLSIPLNTPTRYVLDEPLTLRSVFFAWQKKDAAVPDYIQAIQRLNEELKGSNGAGEQVQILKFVQKLDLVAWLEGASDESENIKPLAGDAAAAAAGSAADIAAGAGGVPTVPSGGGALVGAGIAGSRVQRDIDPRLAEIYNGERRLGDRNSVLRGIKPTDFSHVRKIAATFLSHTRNRPGQPVTSSASHLNATSSSALVSNLKKPSSRRLEPIILLSPSASSVLRMSNVKSFLNNGIYTAPDSSSAAPNLLHLTRLLPSIDHSRPLRFILVDTPDQFKPDYWSRVVAVFTTGQTWQFKSYKWTQPQELFTHALGIYVGWRGEDLPAVVKGWGRGVISTQIDKWSAAQGATGRWRDREVVEGIWGAIEESMKSRGWGKDSGR